MKPSELRIGNLIRDNLTQLLLSVEYISTQSFSVKVLDRSKFPLPDGWKAEPIPLTEQWLLDFGDDWGTWEEYSNGGIIFLCLSTGDFYIPKHRLEYVHQLQNLYFSLTGEELTKK